MADGMWSMSGDGEFELQEPYATMLKECKLACSRAWHGALVEYLQPRCPYTAQQLTDELLRRNEREEGKMMIFEEFVLEALGGDL